MIFVANKYIFSTINIFVSFSFQMITREQFEDALKEIQDEGTIVVMGHNTIRIC